MKGDLYDTYVADMVGLYKQPEWMVLKLQDFLRLWRTVFPMLQLRRSCNVCGKCPICEKISVGKKTVSRARGSVSMFKKARTLHRVMYRGERKALAKRTLHAQQTPGVMSATFDIMESHDWKFPIGVGQNKFSKGVKSTFIGALIHGVGVRFYRTTDCVKKSANLIIHILLTEIEEYKKRNNGDRPKLLYINVRGCGCACVLMCDLYYWVVLCSF